MRSLAPKSLPRRSWLDSFRSGIVCICQTASDHCFVAGEKRGILASPARTGVRSGSARPSSPAFSKPAERIPAEICSLPWRTCSTCPCANATSYRMTATSRIYSPDAAKHNRFERPAPHRDFMSETFLAMPTVFQRLPDRRERFGRNPHGQFRFRNSIASHPREIM